MHDHSFCGAFLMLFYAPLPEAMLQEKKWMKMGMLSQFFPAID